LARWRDRRKKQHYQKLGELEFDEAKAKAEEWLAQMTNSAVRAPKLGTVRQALERYIEDLRSRVAPGPPPRSRAGSPARSGGSAGAAAAAVDDPR